MGRTVLVRFINVVHVLMLVRVKGQIVLYILGVYMYINQAEGKELLVQENLEIVSLSKNTCIGICFLSYQL